MKRKLFTSLVTSVFLAGLVFSATSCSTNDDVANTNYEVIKNIKIAKNQWKWNESEKRYEAVLNLPELTQYIYENGVQLTYVFIGEEGKSEVQKLLPYIHTYYIKDGNGNITATYTETISCDYQYGNPSTVAFYIQASDLKRDDAYLGDYFFKIAFVWK